MIRAWAAPIFLCLIASSASAEPASADDVSSLPSVAQEARRKAARQLFESGLKAAAEGQYTSAKALFLEAYGIQPHYLALYNVGLADIQLGDFGSAIRHLRRYLSEGGDAIDVERRRAVTLEIQRLEERQEKPPVPSDTKGPADPAGVRPPAATGPATAMPRSFDSSHPARANSLGKPASATPSAQADHERGALSYVLIGSGFAVLAGAASTYVWNHERYRDWHHERQALVVLRDAGSMPSDEASLRDRVSENNARLRAVQRFDAVPLVLAGIGCVLSGIGWWTLTEFDTDTHVEVSGAVSEFTLTTHWAW